MSKNYSVYYSGFVQKNFKRNFSANMVHGLLGMTGFYLLAAPTFLPAYIYIITGSKVAVGAAIGAQFLGMALSSIFSAFLIENRTKVMPVVYKVGWMMRLQILCLSLTAFWVNPKFAFPIIFAFLVFFGFFGGMQGVAFNFLISKIIPIKKRGLLIGWRNFLGGITASIVAYLGGKYLIEANAFGNGYASTFFLSFVLTSIGITALTYVMEPVSEKVRGENSSFFDRLKDIPDILNGNKNYKLFFYARAFAAFGTISLPFYIIYVTDLAVQKNISVDIAYYSVAFLVTQTVSNLFFGKVSDRAGNKIVFFMAMVVWVISILLLISSYSFFGFLSAFAGLGFGLAGYQIATQNILLEFGESDELPMLIAVSDTISHLMMSVAPLLGGLIYGKFGYLALFSISIIAKLICILILLKMADPRKSRFENGC